MFGFGKKDEDKELLVKEKTRCICTLNKYLSQFCTLVFKEDHILFQYENGEMKVYYKDIVSCGKIINSKNGIKDAMDKKILSQSVMQSAGFLAGNFYTLTNNSKMFLYIKFKLEEDNLIHTFLADYDKGIVKAINIVNKRRKKK